MLEPRRVLPCAQSTQVCATEGRVPNGNGSTGDRLPSFLPSLGAGSVRPMRHMVQGRGIFVADMEPFIKWLEEAEEDDGEES